MVAIHQLDQHHHRHHHHHQSFIYLFFCGYDGCDKKYESLRNCNNHMLVKHEQTRFLYLITGCGKYYSYPCTVSRHLKTVHKNESQSPPSSSAPPIIPKRITGLFSCPYEGCDKKYNKLQQCNYQIAIKHDNKRFPCPISSCGKSL